MLSQRHRLACIESAKQKEQGLAPDRVFFGPISSYSTSVLAQPTLAARMKDMIATLSTL